MNVFICPRCNKTFSKKATMLRHLEKLKPCSNVVNNNKKHFICDKCGNTFSHRNSRNFHKNNSCKGFSLDKDEESVPQQIILNISNVTITKDSNNTVTKDSNNVSTMNNLIQHTGHINSFLNETIDYLQNDTKFLLECLNNINDKGLLTLLEKIFFDKDHPENHTVRIKSIKRDLFEILRDGKWDIVDKNMTLEEMIRKGCRVLQVFYGSQKELQSKDIEQDEGILLCNLVNIRNHSRPEFFSIRKKLFALMVSNRTLLLTEQ